MTASTISGSSLGFFQRSQISKLQVELDAAQVEISTGRVADPAKALGSRVGSMAILESRVQSFAVLAQSNEVIKARLDATELALQGLINIADAFRGQLISAQSGVSTLAQASNAAVQAVEEALSVMNTSYAGRALFSGVEAPRTIGNGSGGVAEQVINAVADRFAAAFGFKPDSPDVASIPSDDIQRWLEVSLPEAFAEPEMRGLLSIGGSSVPLARIGEDDYVSAGVSSESPAFGKLFMSFVSTAVLGRAKLGDDAQLAVVKGASGHLEEGSATLVSLRADIGSVVQRIESSNRTLNLQTDLFRSQVSDVLEIDAFETSIRIESLRSRLEASYAITARMSRLSLMNFL